MWNVCLNWVDGNEVHSLWCDSKMRVILLSGVRLLVFFSMQSLIFCNKISVFFPFVNSFFGYLFYWNQN